MTTPPKCPHDPNLELAIKAGWTALDMAERGRAPSADIARLRDILTRLATPAR
jgi:hypothetical protein